jgi:hypothetical protein
MAADKKFAPNNPSSDYLAMQPYWEKVQAILDGIEALRLGGEKYLPRFLNETREDYQDRLKRSKLTNIFGDIVANLSAKSFSRTLVVKQKTVSTELKDLCEDIDAAGTNLHVFAGETFYQGIAKALDYIFVDYTKVPAGATVAQEKALGARPYWVGRARRCRLYRHGGRRGAVRARPHPGADHGSGGLR